MHTLDDLLAAGVAGRTVLVRSDLNVPLDGSVITDDGRISASLPTLQALILGGAKVVVTAHLGRPKGRRKPSTRWRPAAARLGELLGGTVPLADGPGRAVRRGRPWPRCADGRRRDAGERPVRRAGDLQGRGRARGAGRRPGRRWSATGAAFVSDGFGVVHRKQASVYEIAAEAAALRRLPGVRGDRRAEEADRRSGAAVRGDPRRVEGVRQARGHHLAAAAGWIRC